MPDARLAFSTELYSTVAINAAARAFEGLAHFDVAIGDAEVIVTISQPNADLAPILADEFANFALNETISTRRAPTAAVL